MGKIKNDCSTSVFKFLKQFFNFQFYSNFENFFLEGVLKKNYAHVYTYKSFILSYINIDKLLVNIRIVNSSNNSSLVSPAGTFTARTVPLTTVTAAGPGTALYQLVQAIN